MATHFSAEDENGTSTPEAILALAPVTVYVTGTFGAAELTVLVSDVTGGTYIATKLERVRKVTASNAFNVVASGFLKFEITGASDETSLTVITVS